MTTLKYVILFNTQRYSVNNIIQYQYMIPNLVYCQIRHLYRYMELARPYWKICTEWFSIYPYHSNGAAIDLWCPGVRWDLSAWVFPTIFPNMTGVA